MDAFRRSCDDAANYPDNLVSPQIHSYSSQAYARALDREAESLLHSGNEAEVHFWETQPDTSGLCTALWDFLPQFIPSEAYDAASFTRAKNSRDKLRITREMLVLILSYHQVMPQFLDLLFPFGEQVFRKEFHFSTLRHAGQLHGPHPGFDLPELGRSGRFLQLCYNLESVEPGKPEEWPWSIRQAAIYHSFDLETGRTVWIMIKGNSVIKNRVMEVTKKRTRNSIGPFHTLSQSFMASLEVHLLLCDWAAEGWREYIKFLHNKIWEATQDKLTYSTGRGAELEPRPTLRESTNPRLQPRRSTFDQAKQAIRRMLTGERKKTSATATSESETSEDDEYPPDMHDQTPNLTFESLKGVHHLQEKVDEILLVFELSIKVLCRLNQYYSEIVQADSFPDDLRNDCRTSIGRFTERVSGVINDLQMQQARVDRILGVLKDRKAWLHDILNYESMMIQKSLTWKSQLSTERMEKMTESMQQIAVKTERETVSMRIVTVVTLIFLPGTFISTLMSTDVIRYPDNLRVFSNRALTMYLSLTLPLMLLTFICAYIYYRRLRRREKAKWDDPETAEPDQAPSGDAATGVENGRLRDIFGSGRVKAFRGRKCAWTPAVEHFRKASWHKESER